MASSKSRGGGNEGGGGGDEPRSAAATFPKSSVANQTDFVAGSTPIDTDDLLSPALLQRPVGTLDVAVACRSDGEDKSAVHPPHERAARRSAAGRILESFLPLERSGQVHTHTHHSQ